MPLLPALTIASLSTMVLMQTMVRASEPVRPLTLAEAVAGALGKNYRVESARIYQGIARADLLVERGAFDPSLMVDYERNEDSSLQQVDPRITSGQRGGLYLEDRYKVGIGGTLPTGMAYDFDTTTRNRRGSFNNFFDIYESFIGLTVRQPLLRGGGTAANLAGIRSARLDVEAAAWKLASEVTDVVTETVFVFNDLSLAHETLATARKSKELALRLLDDNMKRAEIGVMTPLDITSARAEVALREETVLEAERSVREYEHSLLALVSRNLAPTGQPSSSSSRSFLQIAAPPRLEPMPSADVGTDDLAAALLRRPEYQAALLDLKRQRIQLAYEKNRALPTIDLVASFGLNGIAADAIDSLERATDEGKTEWTLGIEASVPFPNREGRGRVFSREMQLAQALIETKRLEQSISVEVADARQSVDTALKLIAATRTTRILAEERLAAEEEKLRAGTTTTYVVLELQKDLAEAEVREIRATTSHNKAVAELDRATGRTLDRYAIRID